MTIKFFLVNWGIEGKENDVIEKDLIKIIEDNGCKVKKSSLETNKEGTGKWFNVELENSEEEQQIANDIQQIKLYNKLNIRPEIYYELIIKNIPNDSTEESLKEELKKLGKYQSNDMQVKIQTTKKSAPTAPTRKYAYITVSSLEEANNLLTNLNNQSLKDRKLKVEFSEIKSTPKREITSSDSYKNVERKTVETDITALGAFYKQRDYDLVTETLKKFIYEVCTHLSNLPHHQEVTKIKQEKNNSDLKQDE